MREGTRLIRLGLVDDHPVFLLGLTRAFEREHDFEVGWALPDLTDLHAMLSSHPVDLVLLDLYLGPDQDALAATRQIRTTYESVKVIIVSASLDWESASGARAAGASGYLPKDLSIADMIETIRALSSPTFGTRKFTDLLDGPRPGKQTPRSMWMALTRREQEVLAELRHGRSNREIAAAFGVSVTTVNKHVQQVLKKLQVRTRSQAIAMAAAVSAGRSYTKPTPTVNNRIKGNGHF